MSSKDRRTAETPDEKELEILTSRAQRERAVQRLERRIVETPPDWEDNEEPSYRVAHSEPGQRLSVEGPDAVEAAKALAQLRELSKPGKTIRESLAPMIEKMGHKGRVAAIVTGIVTVITVLVEVLRQLGAFNGGP